MASVLTFQLCQLNAIRPTFRFHTTATETTREFASAPVATRLGNVVAVPHHRTQGPYENSALQMKPILGQKHLVQSHHHRKEQQEAHDRHEPPSPGRHLAKLANFTEATPGHRSKTRTQAEEDDVMRPGRLIELQMRQLLCRATIGIARWAGETHVTSFQLLPCERAASSYSDQVTDGRHCGLKLPNVGVETEARNGQLANNPWQGFLQSINGGNTTEPQRLLAAQHPRDQVRKRGHRDKDDNAKDDVEARDQRQAPHKPSAHAQGGAETAKCTL